MNKGIPSLKFLNMPYGRWRDIPDTEFVECDWENSKCLVHQFKGRNKLVYPEGIKTTTGVVVKRDGNITSVRSWKSPLLNCKMEKGGILACESDNDLPSKEEMEEMRTRPRKPAPSRFVEENRYPFSEETTTSRQDEEEELPEEWKRKQSLPILRSHTEEEEESRSIVSENVDIREFQKREPGLERH